MPERRSESHRNAGRIPGGTAVAFTPEWWSDSAGIRTEKKKRQQKFMTILINGKQKRVKRPPTIDGIGIEEFIRKNADPIWLHQNEMWEYMDSEEPEEN